MSPSADGQAQETAGHLPLPRLPPRPKTRGVFGNLLAVVISLQRRRKKRYDLTTCFETFPFPQPTEAQRTAIADAAAELDRLRSNWLNPAEWVREDVLEFLGSVEGPWTRYVHDANAKGIGVVRFPRLVPRDEECGRKLAKRTLTNLYNERPTWLDMAHRKLDETVFAAYGWEPDIKEEAILAGLLKLIQERE
jgi:hypothetical protein